jgi:D-alanine transaminase
MSRFAYVNGVYVRHGDAAVHIEDRGYQFADAVYEVWSVMGGKLADAAGHFARLWRSLGELSIAPPMSEAALRVVLRELIRRNGIDEGLVYLQVSRGVARRDHLFPQNVAPAIVATARRVNRVAQDASAAAGIGVITTPENRWGRCDIKTVGLLPNLLAKQAAKESGATEAWFVDGQGQVTEASSSNAWIVDQNGVLRTRETTANILRGITRTTLMEVLKTENLKVEERPFTVDEALSAREAFVTGAGGLLQPVVRIDGKPIGDGRPGPVATRLRAAYIDEARRNAD